MSVAALQAGGCPESLVAFAVGTRPVGKGQVPTREPRLPLQWGTCVWREAYSAVSRLCLGCGAGRGDRARPPASESGEGAGITQKELVFKAYSWEEG